MRGFVILLVVVGAVWAGDRFANHGRYGDAFWREAKYRGQAASDDIKHWLNKYTRRFSQ
jgi:hypothetical protein